MSTSEEKQVITSSPRELFLQLFVFVTLYMSLFSLWTLFFSYIDIWFPERIMSFPYLLDTIRYHLAFLMVMFPVYCGVSFLVIKEDKQNPLKKQIKSRRFLVALTLFLAGLVGISAVAYVLYYFFQGEAGIRIFLKSLTVILIGAFVFYYYYWDLKRNWRPVQLYIVGGLIITFVAVSIGYGFTLTGSPWKAKALKEDQAQIEVLKNLQGTIMQYWTEKKQFPDSLAELGIRQGDSLNLTLPGVPQALTVGGSLDLHGNSVYKKTGKSSFQLCATFKYPSFALDKTQFLTNRIGTAPNTMGGEVSFLPTVFIPRGSEYLEYNAKNDNWEHAAGAVCFSRQFALKK
jgi:hypothetical protein